MSSIQDILKLTPELNQLSKSDTSKKSGVEKEKTNLLNQLPQKIPLLFPMTQ
jgi:hypothetical protein